MDRFANKELVERNPLLLHIFSPRKIVCKEVKVLTLKKILTLLSRISIVALEKIVL